MGAAFFVIAQSKPLFFKEALQAKRDTFYNRTVRNINNIFLLPLNDATEEKWEAAFYNINLLNYKNAKVDGVIKNIAKQVSQQSDECKIAFLNLLNNQYPKNYYAAVLAICSTTSDVKVQAMSLHYLLNAPATKEQTDWLKKKFKDVYSKDNTDPIIHELNMEADFTFNKKKLPEFSAFFDSTYLPNTTIVFSFQRKNRNYPGLAMIRKANGSFVKNTDGTYFAVGQLARSLSNMPGYISNGNTPQGIFTMHGFDTSQNYFIGPTTNIQLCMPNEIVTNKNGDTIPNNFTLEKYKNLLPENCKNYAPLFSSFYAGKAGRTEIIAHGTTINPSYYSTNSYYPFTPTMGCLTSVEIWDSKTGFIQKSDQKKLTDALQKNGGAIGYLIVVEIEDKNEAVQIADLMKYLKK